MTGPVAIRGSDGTLHYNNPSMDQGEFLGWESDYDFGAALDRLGNTIHEAAVHGAITGGAGGLFTGPGLVGSALVGLSGGIIIGAITGLRYEYMELMQGTADGKYSFVAQYAPSSMGTAALRPLTPTHDNSGGIIHNFMTPENTRVSINPGQGTTTFIGNDSNNTFAGTNKADTYNGGAGNDRVWGHEGADSLGGGTGNDILRGSEGNDSLAGHQGTNTLTGGSGADTFRFSTTGISNITDFQAGYDHTDGLSRASNFAVVDLAGDEYLIRAVTSRGTLTFAGDLPHETDWDLLLVNRHLAQYELDHSLL